MGGNDSASSHLGSGPLTSIAAQMRAILPGLALDVVAVVVLAGIVHYGTDANMSLFHPELGEKSGLQADVGFLTLAGILMWWTAATVAAIAASSHSTRTEYGASHRRAGICPKDTEPDVEHCVPGITKPKCRAGAFTMLSRASRRRGTGRACSRLPNSTIRQQSMVRTYSGGFSMGKRVYASASLVVAAFALVMGFMVGVPGSSATFASQNTGGAWPAGPFPAHIHSGTCEELGDVVYPLIDLEPYGIQPSEATPAGSTLASTPAPSLESATPVGTPERPAEVLAQSTTVVESTLDDILAAEHAINVHESPENIQNYVACGNLTGTPIDGMLEIELEQLNESLLVGDAVLVDNGDGTTTVTVRVMVMEGAGDFGTETAPLPVDVDEATPEN